MWCQKSPFKLITFTTITLHRGVNLERWYLEYELKYMPSDSFDNGATPLYRIYTAHEIKLPAYTQNEGITIW